MPKVIPLDPASEWVELSSTEEDWDRFPSRLLMTMLVQLYLIRAFEEEVLQLAGQGLIHGPAHSSIGQEGGAVGSCLSLRSDDQVTGSHRGHHQFLAKALGHVAPDGLEPTTDLPPAVREVLERSLARSAAWPRATAVAAEDRCTCSGGKLARWAPTPSSAARCRRPRVRLVG